MSAGDWMDRRTGYRALLRAILEEPVPGGARWWYVGGATLAVLAVMQAVTGVVLASHYAPSTESAWASVAFIQDTLRWGWFVRGLHSACASAMVVVAGLHLAQTALWGAYRAPRELNWIAGVLMLFVLLGFALTGYLLPWDQKGYWATRVATGIVATLPMIGGGLERTLLGGAEYGSYTLTRFFTLHVLVLPALLFGLLALHLALFRRHKVTPSWRVTDDEAHRTRGAFWPDQLFRDAVAAALVAATAVAVCLRGHGADLDAPADPASTYVARPEWYFRPLFQLLRWLDGSAEIVGTAIVPGLVLTFLLALPFLDRARSRSPRRRLKVLAPLGGLLLAGLGLGWMSYRADAHDADYRRQRIEASQEAQRARRLALQGVPAPGGTAVYRNDPQHRERELWDAQCRGCHSLSGLGGSAAPDLHDYLSRRWISRYLRDPDGPLHMGPAKMTKGMKPVKATPDELAALVELVYRETGAPDADGALAERGRALFGEKDCDACHDTDGTSGNTGPNLGGWGTAARIAGIIRDPGAEENYGSRNRMRGFAGVLDDGEIERLARFVASQRAGLQTELHK